MDISMSITTQTASVATMQPNQWAEKWRCLCVDNQAYIEISALALSLSHLLILGAYLYINRSQVYLITRFLVNPFFILFYLSLFMTRQLQTLLHK